MDGIDGDYWEEVRMEETLIWVEYFVEVSGFTRAKFSTGLMWFIKDYQEGSLRLRLVRLRMEFFVITDWINEEV